jgi:DNA modification methylase
MGSFYRSKHELCFVFKNGGASHTNTFELGQHGRYRTNVWEYAGVNTFRNGRLDELAMHPTVKPVAMIADAIRDVTRRAEIVLDPFAGSGTTVIAAEKTGRHARALEYDPGYCDVIVRRWQKYTGKTAILDGSERTFEDIEGERLQGRVHPTGSAQAPGSVAS